MDTNKTENLFPQLHYPRFCYCKWFPPKLPAPPPFSNREIINTRSLITGGFQMYVSLYVYVYVSEFAR